MTQATALGSSYIIAARRTALGRPGGLHRSRRIESLTAPVVLAALEDAGLEAGAVDEIIFGNTTAGGNPARIIGLAAGLRESVPALTVDRQCASGLDAILLAMRAVALGEARCRGRRRRESLSTAPWRVARPKSLFQTPRFMGLEPEDGGNGEAPHSVAASEELARQLGITRDRQDSYTLHSHRKAEQASSERRFVGEIVPLKMAGEEARDESADRARHRGPRRAGAAAAARRHAHQRQHQPAARCRRRRGGRVGSGACRARRAAARSGLWRAARRASARPRKRVAPVAALEKLLRQANGGFSREQLGPGRDVRDLRRAGAGAARCLRSRRDELSPDGGALARGHPLGAASAVSVVRLFTAWRGPARPAATFGAVTQGAIGGLGVAALFEAV